MEKSANIRHVISRRCAALGIPVSGIFELTPRCNLRCQMCYVRMTPEQMAPLGRERTAAQWLSIGKHARDAGLTFLLITGGEPTLRSDFPEIYEGLTQLGLSISINTNATCLTPQIRELWHKLPPAQVNVTLYGVCREDYRELCGNPDAFDAVVDGLQWLHSEGILVHLNTTMAPANRDKWLQLEQFAQDQELELRMTAYCFPPIRRDSCTACSDFTRLSPEDAAHLAVNDILFREGMDGIRSRATHWDAPIQSSCKLDIGEPIQCLAARSQFWINWNGQMTPCGMLNTPAVSLAEDGSDFSRQWEELKTMTGAIRLCPECSQCSEKSTCLNCAAVTYAETGRFDGRPDYMCQFNRAYRSRITELAQLTE